MFSQYPSFSFIKRLAFKAKYFLKDLVIPEITESAYFIKFQFSPHFSKPLQTAIQANGTHAKSLPQPRNAGETSKTARSRPLGRRSEYAETEPMKSTEKGCFLLFGGLEGFTKGSKTQKT